MSRKRAPFVLTAAVAALCATAVPASAHPLVPPKAPSVVAGTGTQARHVSLAQAIASVRPSSYTVQAGDTLTSIAGRIYHQAAAWPVLYWANHGTVRWADIIGAGQVLTIPAVPAEIPAAPGQLRPAPAPVHLAAAAVTAGLTYAPVVQAAAGAAAAVYSGGTPGGAFGQCVVARESGGNAQVMNSSGHYGLYQFSASTWAAYGGSSADFGHASAGEQNQVFATALARGGQSNWSPYDGC